MRLADGRQDVLRRALGTVGKRAVEPRDDRLLDLRAGEALGRGESPVDIGPSKGQNSS